MKKQKLISDTGSGSKIIINLEVAKEVLSEGELDILHGVLDHLDYVQVKMNIMQNKIKRSL
jgi:hypothetical protein